MSCQLWRDWIDAYLDDGCTPEESAGIEDHLNTCTACAAEALARLRLKNATRIAAAARFVPAPDLQLRIEQSIQKPHGLNSAIPFVAFPRFRFPVLTKQWKQGLAVASAVLVLAVIVLSVMWSRSAGRQQALSQLLDMHVATLASSNPVDVASTDQHTVKPWFEGKLPYTFNLPDLDGTSFKLMGGKLMYYRNRPGAQLLFDLRKHQISVFILQDQPGLTPKSLGVATERQRGFNEETWGQAGLRYVIIGDTSAADVRALGDLLRAAGRQ
jgi:anti-sigma factor RsiW